MAIALLIIGLFLSLVSSRFLSFLAESKLESQAKIVKALIELAMDEAVSGCQSIEITFRKREIHLLKDGKTLMKKLSLDEGMSFEVEEEERIKVDEVGSLSGRIPNLIQGDRKVTFRVENPLLGTISYELK